MCVVGRGCAVGGCRLSAVVGVRLGARAVGMGEQAAMHRARFVASALQNGTPQGYYKTKEGLCKEVLKKSAFRPAAEGA